MLRETMHVKPSLSNDADGRSDPTFGAARAQKCRRLNKTRTVQLADGRELTSSTVYATDVEVTTNDLVFAPGLSTTSNNNGRRPIDVESATTMDGRASLWVVYL